MGFTPGIFDNIHNAASLHLFRGWPMQKSGNQFGRMQFSYANARSGPQENGKGLGIAATIILWR
jgi:hypothetical protein